MSYAWEESIEQADTTAKAEKYLVHNPYRRPDPERLIYHGYIVKVVSLVMQPNGKRDLTFKVAYGNDETYTLCLDNPEHAWSGLPTTIDGGNATPFGWLFVHYAKAGALQMPAKDIDGKWPDGGEAQFFARMADADADDVASLQRIYEVMSGVRASASAADWSDPKALVARVQQGFRDQ